jgi:hypothetical protein
MSGHREARGDIVAAVNFLVEYLNGTTGLLWRERGGT